MSFSVLEELKILDHSVSPKFLGSLIHQIAMGEGIAFYTGYKVFDGTIEVLAQSYLDKLLGIITRVNQVDSGTIKSLQKIIISLIGDSAVTWQQVQDATDEQWETFITDNMLRTFELLGRVLKSEKTAYDALPQ